MHDKEHVLQMVLPRFLPQTDPWLIITSATRRKAVMFAPAKASGKKRGRIVTSSIYNFSKKLFDRVTYGEQHQ